MRSGIGPGGVVRRPIDGAQRARRKATGSSTVADSDLIDIAAAEVASDQVVLITTGTQGEPMSALSRMSRGEHRGITLTAE